MKKTFLLLFVIFTNLVSAKTFHVMDAETKKPLVAASVYIKAINADFEKMVFTDKKGDFNSDYSGIAYVNITYVGYDTFSDTLELAQAEYFNLMPTDIYFDEIVTTGQYAPKSIQKSVYNVSVISDEKIKTQGASNLRDVMMTQNNVNLSQDGILGSSISINGMSGQDVKIMVDGVPVIGRNNGFIDISQINMNNVKQVEVIEGPMSAIYGTDALGGVINIITNDKVDNDFSFTSNSLYESVGKYNFDGNLSYSYNNHKFIVNGGRYFFGGYDQTELTRYRQWKPKVQYFGDFNYIYDHENFKLKYKSDYYQDFILNRGAPRPPYGESAFDDKYYTFRFNNSVFFNGKIGKSKYYDVTLNYSNYKRIKNTFIKDLVTLNEKLTSDPEDQDTTLFHTIITRATYSDDDFSDSFKYQTGIDFQIDMGEGEKFKKDESQISNYAWFLSMQYEMSDKIVIQPAVRLIYNTKYNAPVIPSINIKYDIASYLTARAAYSKGFRAPSLKELYLLFVDINHNIQGSVDLDAEKSDSYNLSFNFHKENQEHAFKLEPSFFYNDKQNLITLANVEDDLYSYVNIGNQKTAGYNLSLSYFRPDITSKFTYSYLGKSYSFDKNADLGDFRFYNEFQANIIYTIPVIETKFGVFYKYTGEKDGLSIDAADEISEYIIEGYSMLDLTLTKSFMHNKIVCALGVKNILDVKDINQIGGASGEAHTGGAESTPIGYGRTLFCKFNFTID